MDYQIIPFLKRRFTKSCLIAILAISVVACDLKPVMPSTPTATPTATLTVTATATPTQTPTLTATTTPTPTLTPTITRTPTKTLTPTITRTPTPTLTPTFDLPDAIVKMQAHCRYGPSTGYLHAGDLYEGDHGEVGGRNYSGTWLYIKFDKLWYWCWAAASVLDVQGDVMKLYVVQRRLPKSTLYQAPTNVQASRSGSKVTVTWNKVDMTEDDDRGYAIEANICQGGNYLFVVVATNNTSYEFTDEAGCNQPSNGLLYTVEKHGYTDPVKIPWPAP